MTTATPHKRIALVTGAGSGIGLACAKALVADGWRVVYTGRRADALAAAIAQTEDSIFKRAFHPYPHRSFHAELRFDL